MDMIVLDKEGMIVKELTSQGKNAILNRELVPFELEIFTVIGKNTLIAAAIGFAIKLDLHASALVAFQSGHVMIVGCHRAGKEEKGEKEIAEKKTGAQQSFVLRYFSKKTIFVFRAGWGYGVGW
ncbi:hypothetical protein KKHLCK_16925 [Candidatus Electrothrix laxa]